MPYSSLEVSGLVVRAPKQGLRSFALSKIKLPAAKEYLPTLIGVKHIKNKLQISNLLWCKLFICS